MSRACRPITAAPPYSADRLNRDYPAPSGWSGWGLDESCPSRVISRLCGTTIVITWSTLFSAFFVLDRRGVRPTGAIGPQSHGKYTDIRAARQAAEKVAQAAERDCWEGDEEADEEADAAYDEEGEDDTEGL